MTNNESKRYILTDLTAEEMKGIGQGRFSLPQKQKWITIITAGICFFIALIIAMIFQNTPVKEGQHFSPMEFSFIPGAIGLVIIYVWYIRPSRKSGEAFLKDHEKPEARE